MLGLLIVTAPAAAQSPYAGEEHRAVKSLSSKEIDALKSGKGMGFAKLAELNRFPGPRHVLDLKDKLELTDSQLTDTQALFDEMLSEAKALGEQLIDAESRLDLSFEEGTINADSLQSALADIGRIRSQLRFVHLRAHLRQKKLLTETQISRYNELRGYEAATAVHSGHHD